MKRILFLHTDMRFMDFFPHVVDRLLKEGNQVLAISSIPVDGNRPCATKQARWDNFVFHDIEEFDPDTIISFNGYHPSVIPALKYLKTKYNVFHAECGWLPQRGHAYLDTDMGYGGEISKGFVYDPDFIRNDAHKEILFKLSGIYKPNPIKVKIPDHYILVPLQLEHDVSIWKDSPYFRLMRSLIGFILKQAPKAHVVVKQHPLGHRKEQYNHWTKFPSDPRVTVIYDKYPTTNDLVFKASMVVGLNSTTLIEALAHGKPVIQLAGNVSEGPRDEYFNTPGLLGRDFLKAIGGNLKVNTNEQVQKMLYLYANQYCVNSPCPDWLYDKIINYRTLPRTVKDL